MTESKKQYGLQVIGRVRVFRKDKEITGSGKKSYTISDVWFNTSEKEENGDYFNKSTNMLFKKGLDLPENNTVIEVAGFPVVTGTGTYRRVAIMVTDWAVSE